MLPTLDVRGTAVLSPLTPDPTLVKPGAGGRPSPVSSQACTQPMDQVFLPPNPCVALCLVVPLHEALRVGHRVPVVPIPLPGRLRCEHYQLPEAIHQA
jgi:hypothetical protein